MFLFVFCFNFLFLINHHAYLSNVEGYIYPRYHCITQAGYLSGRACLFVAPHEAANLIRARIAEIAGQ
jgi:hypothetical protein